MFQALATLVITTLPLLPTTSRASVLSVYLHTQLTPLLLFLHLTHISPSSIWFSCFSSSSPGPRGLDGTCCFKSSDYQQFCSSFPLLTALGELLLCLRQRLQSFLHNGVKKKKGAYNERSLCLPIRDRNEERESCDNIKSSLLGKYFATKKSEAKSNNGFLLG